MNLKNLINLLPSYFKHKDTYKDSEGRGILERFLSLCGEYLEQEVIPDIDNILEIINIEPYQGLIDNKYSYINQIWEFLGSIPYGYAALYDNGEQGDPWKLNYDSLPRAKFYDIVRFSVSLYKIRGTLKFYPILMRFYDIDCKVLDPSGNEETPDGYKGRYLQGNEYEYITDKIDGRKIKEYGEPSQYLVDIPHYDTKLRYDTDDAKYDTIINCLGCTNVRLILDIGKISRIGTVDGQVKRRIFLILNRYRPVNVVPFSNDNVIFINGK